MRLEYNRYAITPSLCCGPVIKMYHNNISVTRQLIWFNLYRKNHFGWSLIRLYFKGGQQVIFIYFQEVRKI